ncbi:MAG: folate-binding protein YgfZ [Gemmatimonadetes bacterium]|nr:folate-binding protein YgfZ [Gemmatimonadota bacterium]
MSGPLDAVVAVRTDRSFVRVHGRDPVKMVQGLVSNDIVNASPGRAVYAAVLTPKGKMVADVRVLRHGADLLLETDVGAAEALMAHLRKFVPPLFAKFEDANASWGEVGVYGAAAHDVLAKVFNADVRAGAREDELIMGSFDGAGADPVSSVDPLLTDAPPSGEPQPDALRSARVAVMIVATSQFGVPGFDVMLPEAQLESALEALLTAGARPIGHAALEVMRIEAGRPRWGMELTENTIPLEAGLRDRAISQTKGCYTGQEVIVRILHRGHVNWILRKVLLGEVEVPAAETALVNRDDGKKVGRITSAVVSPRYGQTIALAYVRREVEPGAEVRLEEGGGRMVTVVEADAEPIMQNGRARHGNAH